MVLWRHENSLFRRKFKEHVHKFEFRVEDLKSDGTKQFLWLRHGPVAMSRRIFDFYPGTLSYLSFCRNKPNDRTSAMGYYPIIVFTTPLKTARTSKLRYFEDIYFR